MKTFEERFWNNVSKASDSECWEWMGYRDLDGYGKIGKDRAKRFAHRMSWELHFGKIPKGMIVRHLCHNPTCVNPSHLATGSHSDNIADRLSAGRWTLSDEQRKSRQWPKIGKRTLADKFWNKVDKGAGCWEWAGCRHLNGYGVIGHNYKTYLAHRVSYEISFGIIPEGMLVCHKCDNRSCVNPDHLFIGSYHDNVIDMISKGRGDTNGLMPGWNKGKSSSICGERHQSAKLSESIVIDILNSEEYGTVLADRYGVSRSVISCIRRRVTWKHIPIGPKKITRDRKTEREFRARERAEHAVGASA
jgi:hypothetical protein